MARKNTALTVEERRKSIAVVIAAEGWSAGIISRLMEEHNLSQSQIYKEKQAVIAMFADLFSKVPVEERRAEVVLMLQGTIAAARAADDHRTAIAGIKLLSEIYGVKTLPPPVVIAIDNRDLTGDQAVIALEERIKRAGLSHAPVIDLDDGDR